MIGFVIFQMNPILTQMDSKMHFYYLSALFQKKSFIKFLKTYLAHKTTIVLKLGGRGHVLQNACYENESAQCLMCYTLCLNEHANLFVMHACSRYSIENITESRCLTYHKR